MKKTLSKGLPLLPPNSQLSFVPSLALQGFLTDVWSRQNKSTRGHNPKWFSVWRRCVIHWLRCSDRAQDKDYKPWITHTHTHTHAHKTTVAFGQRAAITHLLKRPVYRGFTCHSFISLTCQARWQLGLMKWNSTSRNLIVSLTILAPQWSIVWAVDLGVLCARRRNK